jgi:hypothetical protein
MPPMICTGVSIRRLDLRQLFAEDLRLGRVGAHVAHRLDEAVAVGCG